MHIVLTGNRGFIGQHLQRELEAQGHYVKGWDILDGPEYDLRHIKPFDVYCDIRQPDLVIHLAAKVGRLFGEDNVRQTVDDNCGMTALVAQVCGQYGVRMVYASTSEVYGDVGDYLCVEGWEESRDLDIDACIAIAGESLPHNAYGLSKRQGEEYCHLYAPDDLTIWRISMPYGPGLPAGIGRAAMINFLYNALHGLPIQVHRDSERSWCFVADTVRAMRMTLAQPGGVWNIGRDDNPTSMLEVASIACGLTGGSRELIEEIAPPERQTVVKRLSTAKIRGIGWEPEISLQRGMEMTLAAVMKMDAPEKVA